MLNPEKESKKVEIHLTKTRIRELNITPKDNERLVREQLAKKVSGTYIGLWLLIAEHLRLGTWDLLKGWTGKEDREIESHLAMQIVNEAALCVTGVRIRSSLSHQGFEILNGLPYISTDKSIHKLLDAHTISEAKEMQIVLGRLRQVRGDYRSNKFAFDPHRIYKFSKRIMPLKKSNPKNISKKTLQTFFCIDIITGQPVGFTVGSSGKTTSRASLELLDMMESIIPEGGLIMADTEHATAEILKKFYETENYEILMPLPRRKNLISCLKQLKYDEKWAGYAFTTTDYKLGNMKREINLIAQRTGEIETEYQYKGFASTSSCLNKDALKMITEDYPNRWSIEEFFNFEASMGWNRISTMNLNISYGKMSLALIAQAVTHQFRKKLPKPYSNWTAKHLADTVFHGIDGDLRVKNDTIIVTMYNVPDIFNLKKHYEHLPEKLEKEGIDPRVPWLFNFKVDFRFK